MENKSSFFLKNVLLKTVTTLGLCFGAYVILSILGSYPKQEKVKEVKTPPVYFKEKKPDKIIEAKIESWR